VLGLVLLGLLLAYAYPVRVYLAQQAEIAAIKERQAEQRRKIDALAEQRALWDDPEYVKAQARERLHYTLPGELPIIVLDPDALADPDGDPSTERPANPAPWYSKLWSSVGAADQ
jgi:cell division protein FtsB